MRYCPSDNVIHWDEDFATDLSTDPFTGDMSVGYLFSNAYADAIQTALRSSTSGEQRALFADCLTGAWVASIVPPIPADRENQLVLSAGDLDEAIVTAIATADEQRRHRRERQRVREDRRVPHRRAGRPQRVPRRGA